MNTTSLLLVAAVALPLLLALGLASRGGRGVARALAPWAALPALAATFVVPVGSETSLTWLFLGSRVGLDETGRVFLLFTALLLLLSGWFARSYLADDARRGRFFVFFLLAMAGNVGLVLARDVVTFYVCFSLMSFASYGLVVHNGEPESLRAGRVYLMLVVLGELMLFAALAMMASSAKSLLLRDVVNQPMSHATLALLLLGFGIKAGALPLHVWLPLAHPAAPVPASAVLSGAMIKAGLLGWIRFLPLGQEAFPQWGALVIGAGLAAAFYGAIVGVTQSNPKTVLAYSSISQMGLITLPVGAALMLPALWPTAQTAILLYALHHALAKGALFLGVGVASHAGSAWQRRWLLLGLLLPALALIGAPFTSGALAKAALKSDITSLPSPWSGVLPVALPLAAIGTTSLMARFLWLVWSKPAAHGLSRPGLWVSWGSLLGAVGLVAWILPVANVAAREALHLAKVASGLWPLAIGLVIMWVTLARFKRHKALSYPRIPAGDWLAVMSWIAPSAARLGRMLHPYGLGIRSKVTAAILVLPFRPSHPVPLCSRLEEWLRQWTVAGLMLLSVAAVFYLLLSAR